MRSDTISGGCAYHEQRESTVLSSACRFRCDEGSDNDGTSYLLHTSHRGAIACGLFGYLSRHWTSSLATLGRREMRKRDVLLREDVTKRGTYEANMDNRGVDFHILRFCPMSSLLLATKLGRHAWGLPSYLSVGSTKVGSPHSRAEVAPYVARFLPAQVGVDAALFAQYLLKGRTIEAHRAQIRSPVFRLFLAPCSPCLATLFWLLSELALGFHQKAFIKIANEPLFT